MTDLDEVLERFHMTALEYGQGLSNHGPMAAEALVELGHSSLLTGLVDLYAPRLPPFEPGASLGTSERSAALGDTARSSDWVATFEAELAADDWREVLGRALTELAPGAFAAAAHGLLRVAHAARALEREVTPVRLRELAFGLGYWAGSYQELPGAAGARGDRDAVAVFQAFEPVPAELRTPGLFFDAVKVLDDYAPYIDAVESADLSACSSSVFISALCEQGARLYLANPQARVAYAHVVTAPSALRLVLDYADESTRTVLGGAAYQTVLALHAVSATSAAAGSEVEVDEEVQRITDDLAEVRYRAACSLREHSIKLTEACLREHAISNSAIFRQAAADAAVHLERSDGAWS